MKQIDVRLIVTVLQASNGTTSGPDPCRVVLITTTTTSHQYTVP